MNKALAILILLGYCQSIANTDQFMEDKVKDAAIKYFGIDKTLEDFTQRLTDKYVPKEAAPYIVAAKTFDSLFIQKQINYTWSFP